MWKYTKISGEMLRFLIVGGISTVVNYSAFLLLFKLLFLYYLLASCVGYLLGLLIGYPLNRIWTYRYHRKNSLKMKSIYLLVYISSLMISQAALFVSVSFLEIPAIWANFFAISLSTCTNFIGTKKLVFRT
jgi:putative flippase GtrA